MTESSCLTSYDVCSFVLIDKLKHFTLYKHFSLLDCMGTVDEAGEMNVHCPGHFDTYVLETHNTEQVH